MSATIEAGTVAPGEQGGSSDGGTVFLDEIGDISPKTQIDLLRALEIDRVTLYSKIRKYGLRPPGPSP